MLARLSRTHGWTREFAVSWMGWSGARGWGAVKPIEIFHFFSKGAIGLHGSTSRKMVDIREFKICHVAVPVPVKSCHQIEMFGRHYKKVESLRCVKWPSPSVFLNHRFMTESEHWNLVTRFLHDGDGDGDVTNLKLPISVSFRDADCVLPCPWQWQWLTNHNYNVYSLFIRNDCTFQNWQLGTMP